MVGERERRCGRHGANLLDELKARFLGFRRKCGGLDRLQERNAEESGVALEDLDRLGAEAAPRFVDDAPKGFVRLALLQPWRRKRPAM